MSKIKFENLREAVVKTSNSVNTERVYDMAANVRIMNQTEVAHVESGEVKKDGKVVCTFSTYRHGQMNTNFQGVTDVMEMCAILQAVSGFLADVTEAVNEGNVVLVNE